MTNLDFTPLYRSTIGFDRVPHIMKAAMRVADTDVGYPPYNIEKTGTDDYRIVIALAGFSKDDVELTSEQGKLKVRGKITENQDTKYLYRGIAGRSFERNFDLAEHIEVKGATFANGLLTIELKRELPESMKPRAIKIATASTASKSIEHTSQQAA
ncbi:MAG: Hsp20 family protein [Pseudomonadota bacterium]